MHTMIRIDCVLCTVTYTIWQDVTPDDVLVLKNSGPVGAPVRFE